MRATWLVLATSALACIDQHPDCFLWSTIGECEINPQVPAHCAVSCGVCAEIHNGDSAPQVFLMEADKRETLPLVLGDGDSVASLAAGELHLVMLLSSGAVMTFGDDSMGQLGQPRGARRVPLTRRAPARLHWPEPHHTERAVAIGAGRMYSGALLESGALFLWGENTHAQCGVAADHTPLEVAPAELSALSLLSAVPLRVAVRGRVKAFSLGEVHTIVLTELGEVLTFGDTSFGAVCNGTAQGAVDGPDGLSSASGVLTKCDLPLDAGEDVTAVVAGGFHSLVVTSRGRVLAWGDNSHGQLGSSRTDGFIYSLLQDAQSMADIGDAEIDRELDAATRVSELVIPLYAGEQLTRLMSRSFHTAVLTDHGRVLLWGDNAYGQIGAEPANNSKVGDSQTNTPLGPAQGFFAVQVGTGELHTLALDNASQLVSFGLNTRHQLGRMRGATWDSFPDPVKLPLDRAGGEQVELIAAGAHFSAAVSSHRNLYVWGEGLLAADMKTRPSHQRILPASHTSADDVGDVDAPMGGAGGHAGMQTATIATSGAATLAVSAEDDDDTEDVAIREVRLSARAVAACAGGFHFIARLADGGKSNAKDEEAPTGRAGGALVSWGENAASQLCRLTTDSVMEEAEPMEPQPPPAADGATGELLIGCGAFHSLVAVPGVGVFTCGTPTETPIDVITGQPLPNGDGTATDEAPPPPPAASSAPRVGRPADGAAASSNGATARAADGGPPSAPGSVAALSAVALPTWEPSDPIVSLATGHAHSLALTTSGRLFSWGSNEFGQLGRGVPPPLGAMNAASAIPPAAVPLFWRSPDGLITQQHIRVILVAAGAYHTLIVTSSGDAWSFGSNTHGQLVRPIGAPAHIEPMQIVLPPSHRGESVTALAAGLRHSVLLLKSGAVCTFGDHTHAQLGRIAPHRGNACAVFDAALSAAPTRPMPVSGDGRPNMGGATREVGLDDDDEETGSSPEVREADAPPRIIALAAGEMHTLALGADGAVYTWGDNQMQQGGRDLDQPLLLVPGPVPLQLQLGETVVSISAAGYHATAVTSAGRCFTVGKLIKSAIFDDIGDPNDPLVEGEVDGYGEGSSADSDLYDDYNEY